jgi:hypothetical protein
MSDTATFARMRRRVREREKVLSGRLTPRERTELKRRLAKLTD